jgi:hypothetical protein
MAGQQHGSLIGAQSAIQLELSVTAKAVTSFEYLMTPLEFLFKLKNIAPETQLTIAHVGAVFEMLAPVLAGNRSRNSSTSLTARLTSEAALAEWLREPVITIEQWRIQIEHSAPRKYHLGAVYDWIVAHILPMFSASITAEGKSDIQFGDIAEVWKMQIPAMKVDGRLVGFFRSIEEESQPTDYVLVEMPTLSFYPPETAINGAIQINESLIAHAEFSVAVPVSVSRAREIYERWESNTEPEIRLRFFHSALLHETDLAEKIADTLDDELIREGYNPTLWLWLWQQLIEYEFCSLKEDVLTNAFRLADEYGMDLNRLSSIRDNQGQEFFHGGVSHLLADTMGDFSNLQPFNKCVSSYNRLLACVLDLGLQIDVPNKQGLSASDIAQIQDKQYREEEAMFKNFVKKYDLNLKLSHDLGAKSLLKRKPYF